jgi:hypothetical protein
MNAQTRQENGKDDGNNAFPEYAVTILPRGPPRNRYPTGGEHFDPVCAGRISWRVDGCG